LAAWLGLSAGARVIRLVAAKHLNGKRPGSGTGLQDIAIGAGGKTARQPIPRA
jgi:hypothetical protein